MIAITAPGTATQQAALRLAASPGHEGCIVQVPVVVKLRHAKVWYVDSRMACFVVAVVFDTVAVVVCRSSAIVRVLVRN